MAQLINWFEIPVTNLERATTFYQTILGVATQHVNMGDTQMSMLMSGDNMDGALVQGSDYHPSAEAGALVYLNGGEDLSQALDKVNKAGGQVIVPKTQISPEFGYFAMFIDTEGNKMALHSFQ